MRPLSNNTRSNCNSGSQGQNSNFKPVIGWETDVNQVDGENLQQKIIQVANQKISLDFVFNKYNISFEETYSSTGWIYKRTCPFDDHLDDTPSFGYNPKENIFNCFGCHRGGKAVDFISFKEGKSKLVVAKSLLENSGISSYSDVILESFDYNKFKKILFDYADCVREFKLRYHSLAANKYAKAVNWTLDVYLRKNDIIDLDNLEMLIIKLKEQLELFEE